MATSRDLVITMKVQTGDAKASVEGLEAEVKSAAQSMAKDQIAAAESVDKVRKEKELSESERIKRRAKEIGDAARIEMAVLLRNSEDKVKLAAGDEAKIQAIRKNAFAQLNDSIGESLNRLRALGDGGALAYESLENKLRNMSKRIETGNTAFGQLIQNTKNLGAAAEKSGFQQLNASIDALKKQAGPVGGAIQGFATQMGGLVSSTLAGGDAVQGLFGGLGAAASALGPFGQAASVAIGILGALVGEIETAGEKAKRTSEEFKVAEQTFISVNTSFVQMAESIVNGDIVGAAEELKGKMEEFSAVSVQSANELESILNAPGERTADELARIDELMADINEKANEQMLVKQYDAALASLENIGNVIGDIVDEQDAWYESVAEFLNPFIGIADRMEDIKNLTVDSQKAGIEGMKARNQLHKIENEYQKVFIENLRAGMSLEETMKGIREEAGDIGAQELKIIMEQGVAAQQQFKTEQEREKVKSAGYIAEQRALKERTEAEEKANKAKLKAIEDAKNARLKAIEDEKKAMERAQSAVEGHKETLDKEKRKIREMFEDGNISQGQMDARIRAVEAIAAQLDSVAINANTDVKGMAKQFEDSMHSYNRIAKKAEEDAAKVAAEKKKAEEEAAKAAEEAAKKAQADAHKAVLKEYDLNEEAFKVKEDQIQKERDILKDLNDFSKSLEDARTAHLKQQKDYIASLSSRSFTDAILDSYGEFYEQLNPYLAALKAQAKGFGEEVGVNTAKQRRIDEERIPIRNEVENLRGALRGQLIDTPLEEQLAERLDKLEPRLLELNKQYLDLGEATDVLNKKILDTTAEINDESTKSSDALARYSFWVNEINTINQAISDTADQLAKTTDPADITRLETELNILTAQGIALEDLVRAANMLPASDKTPVLLQLIEMGNAIEGIDKVAFNDLVDKAVELATLPVNRDANAMLKALNSAAKLAENDPTLTNLNALAEAQGNYNQELDATLSNQERQLATLDLTSPEYAKLANEIQTTTKAMYDLNDASVATKKQIADGQKKQSDDTKKLLKEQTKAVGAGLAEFAKVVDGGVKEALGGIADSIGVLMDESATEAEKTAARIKAVAGAVTILANIDDVVSGVRSAFEEKGGGGVVSNVSEYFTQIGMALLNSGIPGLTVAGAVILTVGILGDLIGRITTAFTGRAKTQIEAAEDVAAAEAGVRQEYEGHIAAMRTLQEIAHESVDTAKERLGILKEEHALLRENSEYAAEAAEMSDKELSKAIARGDVLAKQREDAMRVGERSLELGRDERVAWLNSQGIQAEWWMNTSIMVEEQLKALEAQGILSTEHAEALRAELDYRKAINAEIETQLSELRSTRDLLIDIALRSNNYARALFRSNQNLAQSVTDVNRSLGTTFADADEAMRFLNSRGIAYFQNLSEEQRQYIRTLMSEYEAVGDAVFADQENLINLRKEAGKISEADAKQQLLDLYNQELVRLTDINATEEERLQLEIKIRDLMNDQNSEADIANQKLTELVHKRQEMIKSLRGGQGSQADLDAQTAAIRAELAAMGKTPDEIEQFIATLPKRAEGGPMSNGLYRVGEKGTEFAVKAAAVDHYGMNFMHRLNAMEFPAPGVDSMGQSAAMVVQNRINTVVNNNMVMNGTTSESLMKWFQGEMTKMRNDIPRIVQKSITSGAVNTTR
jgi:hypothetical protein